MKAYEPKEPTYRIYPGVTIGPGAFIDDYVVVGLPPRDREPGELPTTLGTGALLRSHTVLYAGNIIGDRFQTGHGVLVREENTIGDNVSIGSHTVVEHHVEIGNGVRIHSGAFIPEYTVLGDGCWVGPHAVLTNTLYPAAAKTKERLKGPVIEPQAINGANATIFPGVRIGRGAIVGAGSIVVRDVPPEKVAVGSPARAIKNRKDLVWKESGEPVY